MSALILEITLIDKIDGVLEGLKNCIDLISAEDLENFQKCIMSLFQFYQSYSEALNILNTSLNPTSKIENNCDIEAIRQKYAVFIKEISQINKLPK